MQSDPYAELRTPLTRHAYRMLGTMSDAEDVVQDAFVRWHSGVDRSTVQEPRAYLRAMVTRLCIDRLRSARVQREAYVGPWLPEPIVEDPHALPEDASVLADDVSFALLLALERLSPLERAAFLLHDVLDVPFAEIAAMLHRSEEGVRKLASRARTSIRSPHERPATPPGEANDIRNAFVDAILHDDVGAVMNMLTQEVLLLSDGGGKAFAAINPLLGRDRVGRFLAGVARKGAGTITGFDAVTLNGLPGFVFFAGNVVLQTIALHIEDGKIANIYITRNPDKLRAIARQLKKELPPVLRQAQDDRGDRR